MKVIISTKHLAEKLKEIDLNESSIHHVTEIDGGIRLSSSARDVDILCHVMIRRKGQISQTNRRWDWIQKITNQVDEQPVTLVITENMVSLEFQC